MPDSEIEQELAREREFLAKADRDIAEGEERIAHQIDLMETLGRDGHDVTTAAELLETLRQTLKAWQAHRHLILQAIARLEGSGTRPTARPKLLPET